MAILLGVALPAPSAEPHPLPWEREIPLREAARSVVLKNTLNPANPLPDWSCYPKGQAMTINNLKMRTTLWGTPDRVTISLMKNNVWDRRINTRGLTAPTLQEIIEGALDPANKDYEGVAHDCQRPKRYGYLLKGGGFVDPYREPLEYPMPCQKPVGQIILGLDAFADAPAPQATQSCANGVVKLEQTKGDAQACLQYVLGMTNDLYAIRGEFRGISTPVWLRLYRHRDTTHLNYLSADGKTYTRKGAEKDHAFNYPMDPPTSGNDGRHFWIRQQMPPEKTFPQGFEYVLMGVVLTPGRTGIETVENRTGLGTPPPDRRIAEAPGAAATVTFTPEGDGKFEALVTVVTTLDGLDVLAVAKQRLAAAEAAGFDGVVQGNTQWWNAFYDRRENGRVFYGTSGTQCTDDIQSIYRSYADHHGGGTHTDMRRYECSAEYVHPERDSQLWSSSPCYNEVFTTHQFVRNRADHQRMWKQLVWHWMEGGKDNARTLFGMPGMAILHGYQPPVRPDKIVHTTLTLEFCLETMAQIIRPSWDEWDYGGDINVLRDECYPLMREMALFYAAYAKKGDDGHYHIIPSMEPEKWGWYGGLNRNKDVISSLCMFRWALNRAAEAAEILGVDADRRGQWREIARNLAPYPTWETPEGPVFCAIRGVEPVHVDPDHFGEAPQYPTLLADEINLDSPKEQKETMLRTARKLHNAGTTAQTLILLGQPATKTMWNIFDAESLLNSRSGRMHLFPAMTPGTAVAFRNFQARGAFLVSAAKNAEEVCFLEVQARRNGVCRLMNPWPGREVVVRQAGKSEPVAVQLDRSNGECLEFAAVAGKTYSIKAQESPRKTNFGDPEKVDAPAALQNDSSSATLPACDRRPPEESVKNPLWVDRANISGGAAAPSGGSLLWYRKPAREWTEALPLGNGRLGAMVFGGIADERLQLNVDSLWDGEPLDPNSTNALINLPQIRQLLFDGRNKEAADLAGKTMMGSPKGIKPYQTLGELYLECPGLGGASNYIRALDLDTALATVRYESGGVTFAREAFSSAPDDVIAVRLTASQPGVLSLKLTLKRLYDATVSSDPAYPQAIVLAGQVGGGQKANRIRFAAVALAVNEGGTVTSSNGILTIDAADSVTLLIAGATDFPGFGKGPANRALNPRQQCFDTVQRAANKSFAALKAAHIADHQGYFHRVKLELPSPAAALALPTDERLVRFRNREADPAIAALYFDYGRYLLISCSRPCTLPANLQGLWNGQLWPAWNADYHVNINLQMNYWPANVTGLSDCELPLFDLTESLVKPGHRSAKVIYGADGWVVHHLTDAWGYTAPADGVWGIWPVGAAWLARHPWEHYLYTGDQNFLRKRGWPVMKGAAEFILDVLVQAPTNTPVAGRLVTNPSHSPENEFFLPDGTKTVFTYGATMDLQIVRELLENCISASKELRTDAKFRARCESALARLAPVRIGSDGRLMEWIEEYRETDPRHRHVSHLYGLYPAGQISPATPEFFAAARKSLETRGDGATGWSLAWKINFWARLRDGDHAHLLLGNLLRDKTLPNLFDTHPPFQIDGNFGATAAIAEMLLQSHVRASDGSFEIDLLPALPSAWPEGTVKGLRARGGRTVDITWRAGRLMEVRIAAKTSGPATVSCGGSKVAHTLRAGQTLVLNSDLMPAQ